MNKDQYKIAVRLAKLTIARLVKKVGKDQAMRIASKDEAFAIYMRTRPAEDVVVPNRFLHEYWKRHKPALYAEYFEDDIPF